MVGLLPFIPILGSLIDKIFPDKEARDKALIELAKIQIEGGLKELDAQSKAIIAEAQGDSWLQRSWRPLVMIFFAGLVGSYWFGYTPPNISEATLLELFSLVKLGLGGYVVGRSGEKMMKLYKEK